MSEKSYFINMSLEEIKRSLKEGKISICVIGIGRIGLPTALSFAKSGLPTMGVDINSELVNMINKGIFPLKDEPGYEEIFNQVTKNQKFHVTTEIKNAVSNSDIILLSLPTPMDNSNIPNYSALISVGKQLHDLISEGSLLIIESTIEPGFVENEFIKIIEGTQKRLKAGKNFGIGVCPENANPGEILNDFTKLPRLVGAIDEQTTQIITEIYKHVFSVELIQMPNCKTANAVKLTTNVFRDVNIAFINELSMLFEKLGIDTYKVLEAAKSKYNFQAHYPGSGVGGPCLPINSYQFLNCAKSIGFGSLKIIKISREINESMPNHVVELTKEGFKDAKKSISKSKILILGISYKPNVKDFQLSPAEKIVEKLLQLDAKIKIYDPYFKSTRIFNIKTENNLTEAISDTDAIIIVTAHKEFLDIKPTFYASKMKTPIVIDSRGIIETDSAKKAGLIFRGLGR